MQILIHISDCRFHLSAWVVTVIRCRVQKSGHIKGMMKFHAINCFAVNLKSHCLSHLTLVRRPYAQKLGEQKILVESGPDVYTQTWKYCPGNTTLSWISGQERVLWCWLRARVPNWKLCRMLLYTLLACLKCYQLYTYNCTCNYFKMQLLYTYCTCNNSTPGGL